MKRLSLVAVALALGVFVAPATAAGPTVVSDAYTLGGLTIPGVNTGFVVKEGSPVTVTATGALCPWGGDFCPGADGFAPWDTTWSDYGGFALPGAPAWGLLGRVGDGPWVHVGSGPTTLSGGGVLAFAMNDDLLVDNTGVLHRDGVVRV